MTLSPAVLAEIYAHARAAFPAECCGYVTADARVVRCTNANGAPDSNDSFAIDGRELFDLVRSFDSPTPARVIYHSHPNGRAYFSPTDRAHALADGAPIYPVEHLVVGVDATRIVECAQFAWDGGAFAEVARWVGPKPEARRPRPA